MTPPLKHMRLGPLDTLAPQTIVCLVYVLALQPGVTKQAVFDILSEGLSNLLVQLPWLGGHVFAQSPDTPGWRPGQLEVRYEEPEPGSEGASPRSKPDQLRFHDLGEAGSMWTGGTYKDLKDDIFPLHAFAEHQQLFWAEPYPHISKGPAVISAQANYLPAAAGSAAACLLAVGLHHSVCDGSAINDIVARWAEECRLLQTKKSGPATPAASQRRDEGTASREVIESIWAAEGTDKPVDQLNTDAWEFLGIDYEQAFLNTSPPEEAVHEYKASRPMTAHIFYVSPSQLQDLRQACVIADAEGPAGSPSTANDALMALLWRWQLRVQHRYQLAHTTNNQAVDTMTKTAYLASPVDCRSHFSANLPTPYFGNFIAPIRHAVPLAQILAPASENGLGSVARAYRAKVDRLLTPATVLDMYGIARALPSLDRLVHLNNIPYDLNADAGIVITSTLPLSLYTGGISFGDRLFGNQGRPVAMRPLIDHLVRAARLTLVLPQTSHGGVEMVVIAPADEMPLLLDDEEFGRYGTLLSSLID